MESASRLARSAALALVAGFVLAVAGLAAQPAAAILGGALFVAVGTCLAYDIGGVGDRWVGWKRSLGGPTLGVSVWLDRTLDGAAVACLGIAVAWLAGSTLL